QLGNALVAPVLPYSIAGSHLASKWPGTVNLPAPVFSAVNDAVVQSMVVNGFKHLVLMGDHGGGQRELSELARTLDRKYAPHGSHVYFCSDLYAKTDADVAAWLKEHGLPPGATHVPSARPPRQRRFWRTGQSRNRRGFRVARTSDPTFSPTRSVPVARRRGRPSGRGA